MENPGTCHACHTCSFRTIAAAALGLGLAAPELGASQAAWVFAHRVNTTTDARASDYEELIRIVRTSAGVRDGALRKVWGVWPAEGLRATYVSTNRGGLTRRGGNSLNVFIVEMDGSGDLDTVAGWCARHDLQCGMSAGNPFLGDLGGPDAHGHAQLEYRRAAHRLQIVPQQLPGAPAGSRPPCR